MANSNDVLEYITTHPTEELDVWRMNYSGGVMTLFAIGPYKVRWDEMCTNSFRNHWKAYNKDGMRKHIVRWLATRGNDLYVGDIQLR